MYDDVIEIAKGAGKILLNYHGKKVDVRNKDPDGYSPVCIADLEANKFICDNLKKYGYQILSEELDNKDLDFSKPTWIVDPLDGTIGFLNKSKDFCTMIALMIDKKIVFGVVYIPMHDKLYYAESGKGAWLIQNDKKRKIHVSKNNELEHSSRIISPFKKPNFLETIMDNKMHCKKISFGSVGARLCAVASGEVDFHLNNYFFPKKWDTAAATIILEEAGGKITDFEGDDLDYSKKESKWEQSLIASNSVLHEKILSEIPKDAIRLIKSH